MGADAASMTMSWKSKIATAISTSRTSSRKSSRSEKAQPRQRGGFEASGSLKRPRCGRLEVLSDSNLLDPVSKPLCHLRYRLRAPPLQDAIDMSLDPGDRNRRCLWRTITGGCTWSCILQKHQQWSYRGRNATAKAWTEHDANFSKS
ncbi:hypothetical protein V7S43_005275 [Phytophthora oleae]|uniref:Uncharacterized protein n=1 Tax=Phytophthora oleae TaxID=2107226 RepID=A0ABD3FSI6_9STRA